VVSSPMPNTASAVPSTAPAILLNSKLSMVHPSRERRGN
jgi:hypothetical protein